MTRRMAKQHKLILGLLLALTASSSALAASIDSVFRDSFFDEKIYTENRCGENIERFVLRLMERGVSIKGLQVFEIVNEGIHNFGLLAAYEARIGYKTNWGHHVIAYDGEFIYDLDFAASPEPIRPSAYFDAMFKSPRLRESREACLKEIGSYTLRIHGAQNFIDYQARRARSSAEEKRLRDLPKWGCGTR